MKIKILKILETKQPFQPQGKMYKIYEWAVKGLLDNNEKEYLIVKAFSFIEVKENIELEVKEQTNQYGTCYIVEKQKQNKNWGGYNKPSYTKQEYNDLFKMALKKLKINLDEISEDNKIKLCISYLIGAKDAGVKADHEKEYKKDNNQASDLQKPEFQQNPAKSFLEGKNPEEDLSVDWEKDEEEIPF